MITAYKFSILIYILLFACSAWGLYEQAIVVINYESTFGHKSNVFGYPINYEWTVLVLSYWIFCVSALVLLIRRMKIGWLLAHSLIAMGFIYLTFRVVHEITHLSLILIIQFFLVTSGLLVLNSPMTFQAVGINHRARYYGFSALIFVFYSALFLLTDQYV